jgi:hypothetical protein
MEAPLMAANPEPSEWRILAEQPNKEIDGEKLCALIEQVFGGLSRETEEKQRRAQIATPKAIPPITPLSRPSAVQMTGGPYASRLKMKVAHYRETKILAPTDPQP